MAARRLSCLPHRIARPNVYRCLENLYTVFIPDPDVVARLREGWLLTAYAMSDELGVLLRLAAGRALMSHPVAGRERTG